MKLTKEQLMGLTRHALTFIGGILLAKGMVTEDLLSEIIGSATTLFGAVWSVIEKNKKEKESN